MPAPSHEDFAAGALIISRALNRLRQLPATVQTYALTQNKNLWEITATEAADQHELEQNATDDPT